MSVVLEKCHYLPQGSKSLSDTFCGKTSGYVTVNAKFVTCRLCQRIITFAWERAKQNDRHQKEP